MNFYCIMSQAASPVSASEASLKRACEKHGLRYQRLAADMVTLDEIVRSAPGGYDGLVYRIGTTKKAVEVESLLANLHPGVTTIYSPQTLDYPRKELWELAMQVRAGLPIIPSAIVDATWLEKQAMVQKRVESLGGFPMIIKVLGKSHGQGIVKVDSLVELQQLLADIDYKEGVMARKYLADYRHFRLVVVAGRVVAANEYQKPADDFRTNATEKPDVTPLDVADIPEHIREVAIQSTAIRSSLLGGVDILIDNTTQAAYLAEVNVPCNFARTEGATGIDIGDHIIRAMLDKRTQQEGHDE